MCPEKHRFEVAASIYTVMSGLSCHSYFLYFCYFFIIISIPVAARVNVMLQPDRDIAILGCSFSSNLEAKVISYKEKKSQEL